MQDATENERAKAESVLMNLLCPYCEVGNLRLIESIKYGSIEIECEKCGSRWVDEDDVLEMT